MDVLTDLREKVEVLYSVIYNGGLNNPKPHYQISGYRYNLVKASKLIQDLINGLEECLTIIKGHPPVCCSRFHS